MSCWGKKHVGPCGISYMPKICGWAERSNIYTGQCLSIPCLLDGLETTGSNISAVQSFLKWWCQSFWLQKLSLVNFPASWCLFHIERVFFPSKIALSQSAINDICWKRCHRETLCRAFCCFEEKRCKFARTEAFIRVPRRRGALERCQRRFGWWLDDASGWAVQVGKPDMLNWDGVCIETNFSMSDFQLFMGLPTGNLPLLLLIYRWACWFRPVGAWPGSFSDETRQSSNDFVQDEPRLPQFFGVALWLFNIAMEDDHLSMIFPLKPPFMGDFPWLC